MPVSTTQLRFLKGSHAADLLRFSITTARFAVLVGLSWAIFACLTITASQACAGRDGTARFVSQSSTSPAQISLPAATASKAMIGDVDPSGAGPGSVHHSCCAGAWCSSCPLALTSAAVPSIEPSKVRIGIVVLQGRLASFDPIPDLRPPILFARA
jgi:hypothetical protein